MDVFLANCHHRWGEGVAADADKFFTHDAPSFFGEVGKHLDRAGHESRQGFEGAMAEAGRGFEGTLRCMEEFFAKGMPEFFAQHAHAVARLLADAALFFKSVGEDVVGPAARAALHQLAAGVIASLAQLDVAARRTQRFFEHAAKRVGAAAFVNIKWHQLPKQVRAWVERHPCQTAFYVACGVVFVVPALAYGPALGMMGFSAVGPVAGSLAAGIQSAFSPIAACGVFATLQSAAMGGYGAATVAALTQAGAVAAATAVGSSNHDAGDTEKDGKEE